MDARENNRAQFGVGFSLVLSIVFASLAIGVVFLVVHPLFYVNDDAGIHLLLSGTLTGAPSAYAFHPNILVCWPAALLYGVFPSVNWWFVTLEVCQFVTLVVFNYLCLRIAGNAIAGRSATAAAPVVFSVVAFLAGLCLFSVPIALAHYTFSSASLAAAACALLLSALMGADMGKREGTALLAVAVLLLAASYCVRHEGGIIGIGFFAVISLGVAFFHWLDTRDVKDAAVKLVPCLVAAVVMLGCWAAQEVAYSSPEWRAFTAYNEIRTEYTDYPHETYEQNPELYQSVGWDEPLCELLHGWFMMDERMNADTYAALVAGSAPVPGDDLVKAFLADNLGFSMYSLAGMLGLLALVCVWCIMRNRGVLRWLPLALSLVALACIVYLGLEGRFLYRAAICGVYCALLPSWIAAIVPYADPQQVGNEACISKEMPSRLPAAGLAVIVVALIGLAAFVVLAFRHKGGAGAALLAVFLLICMVVVGSLARGTFGSADKLGIYALICALALVGASSAVDVAVSLKSSVATNDAAEVIDEYVREHPDDLFISSALMMSTDPAETQPRNIRTWGGWVYRTPPWNSVVADWGYTDGFYARDMLDANVYFTTNYERNVERILDYYESLGYAVDVEEVANLDGDVGVYAFRETTGQ